MLRIPAAAIAAHLVRAMWRTPVVALVMLVASPAVYAAAAATISMAFAARAARAGSDSPGLAAVTATLLALGMCSGLALYLTWLPQLGHPLHSTRWWVLAAVAAVAAWWWSRDPAARDILRRAVAHP